MNAIELIVGGLFALLLVVLAVYFAWRQTKVLQALRSLDVGWTADDRHYLGKQARRRLWCSALMIVLAAMLVGSYFLDQAKPARDPNHKEITQEQKDYAWQMTLYWGMALLVVFTLVTLAAMDIVAIGRFAHRKARQLEGDRQAILEAHLAQFRRERNGPT